MKRKNKNEELENSSSIETPRSLMVEKLIMEELLNADDFNILLKTITVLNPMKLLESGYSIVKNKDKVITSIKYINIDDLVNIDLKDGVIKAKVVSKENKNNDQR